MKYGRKPKKIKKKENDVKLIIPEENITYGRKSKKSYFENEDISIGRA